ncbi:expressed unknown protein [Seminavis robusta]|uniref:Uncharacterized protein n=1 Tax=Seminavis robusta TaxID=568900 RepID=A0A9N8EIV9_9STRA|nr:expressed unknown protein [Seminavis robusta]|eukprot:Sro1007_g230430.1 n/a (501) ;mRNA; r:22851-24473
MMFSGGRSKLLSTASRRGLATLKKLPAVSPVSQSILPNLPYVGGIETEDEGPIAYNSEKWNQFQASRQPVSSAHAIDTVAQTLSTQDSVAVNASGSVVHGTYGDLGNAADAIPLEYLALLRFAAQGAAGVRAIASGSSKGTVLVYGASQASGMAATQLASAQGHAVVAVVSGDHAGNTLLMESVKGLIDAPGTAVPEVYALSKKNFADLVQAIATGTEESSSASSAEMLEEFKANLMDYCQTFPENLPAAVGAEKLKFNGMDKDREFFPENMEAYLSQFQPGAPPIDKAALDALFTPEQYQAFRNKFWDQTSRVISGDESHFFSPPHIVKSMVDMPDKTTPTKTGAFPYSFGGGSSYGIAPMAGGAVAGAILVVTPVLEAAAKAVDAAKTLRQKGEALSFLTDAERTAFGAACSVVAVAQKQGAPVVTIGGSLPGLTSVEPSKEDVDQALAAMDIQEDGSTKLNYFVQTYRACDFSFYGDYAVHRANEPMAGPRQIVVTK